MRFLLKLSRRYPLHSSVMVLALLLSGILEGIGISMLLPILSIAAGKQSGRDAGSVIERLVSEGFSALGSTPTIGNLLIILVVAITLKSAMVLLAKKQVGYTVARVATDMRLEMLQALLDSRWQFFLRQPIGSLANAMATEASRASKAYMHGIIMTAEFFQAVVYGIIALSGFLASDANRTGCQSNYPVWTKTFCP